MLKIIQGDQIRDLDDSYLSMSNTNSIDLMEKAAIAFCNWFVSKQFDTIKSIAVFCGAGNNGGDGFAISRILVDKGFSVSVIDCFGIDDKLSPDASFNRNRLPSSIEMYTWHTYNDTPDIIIDAFLGVGMKGELRSKAAEIIKKINEYQAEVISVDIPSGLPSEGVHGDFVVKADYTVTFAVPKLSLLIPENGMFVGVLILEDIGIPKEAFMNFDSSFYYLEKSDIEPLHKVFSRFSHKGDFGKDLVLGGSQGKMGALVLAAKSCLRTGAGLVTCHLEESERFILQSCLPEAMATWGILANLENYDAIGIGPGWGLENRKELLQTVFDKYLGRIVLDADALNLLSKYPELLRTIPKNSILTPHIGEFDRLVGPSVNHYGRLEKAALIAKKYEVIVILKGAHTIITLADGRQLFNSTGNQFMATGGSGDVLTGMITAFLGMGYSPENAAICGVYHHGLAGEIASKTKRRSLIASDIVEAIPETYLALNIS